jgi:hypothetical protein
LRDLPKRKAANILKGQVLVRTMKSNALGKVSKWYAYLPPGWAT